MIPKKMNMAELILVSICFDEIHSFELLFFCWGSVPVVRLIVPGDAVPVVRSLFLPLRRVLRSISAA